jgi:hypothetical protein
MDGIWSGEYVAQETEPKWPELFIYSKNDWYLPYQYLEDVVLAKRKEIGRDFRTLSWDKSAHVEHIRKHGKDYSKAVHKFLDDKYLSQLPAVVEKEVVLEEEVQQDKRERMSV